MSDKNSIVKTLQLEQMTLADQMEVLKSIERTIEESKTKQKEKLKTNVDFVVEALRNIKTDLEDKFSKLDNKLETKVDRIIKGRDGLPGKDGAPGKEGRPGRDGLPGKDGKDGKEGKQGVGVSKAKVDIDGMLVITLTDGKVIEAGKVFTKAVAEKIRVFSNSDNRVPELVGQAGKILSNDGTNLTWVAGGSGSGTVTSVAMSVPTGLSVAGSPVTTSGTLAVTYASGYSIPTDASQSNWTTAYGWGNHASAGYITATSTNTLTNKTLTNPTITNYTETTYTANTSTAITVDLANGTVQILTLTGSPTITMPTATAGKSFVILLKTGSGGYSVTWSTVKWAGGTAPTITTTASKMDMLSFFSDGTNWYGTVLGQNYTP